MNDSKSAELIEKQILWLRRDISTTPMHLIKLVYIAHGWMLGLHDRSLTYEDVFAWQYGPVIPSTYHRYKEFKAGDIMIDLIDRTEDFKEEQSRLIQKVVDAYRGHSARLLSTITHEEGTPWDITRRKFGDGCIIPNTMIKEHYKKLARERPRKSR
ncbi:MAG: hypothetical protein M2R45_02548 [Verrucomicrobia subdivision 3 bacterium]|nr:hypothetical protein [Limisphaerales bacterium]MCS1414245.1 hypothetical protein [Limisphaerales bacterium]